MGCASTRVESDADRNRNRALQAADQPPAATETPAAPASNAARPSRNAPASSTTPLRKIPTLKAFAYVHKAIIEDNHLVLTIDASYDLNARVHIDGTESIDEEGKKVIVKSAHQIEESISQGIRQTIKIGPLPERQPAPPDGGFAIGVELTNPTATGTDLAHMYYYGNISPEDTITWSIERVACAGTIHTAQPLFGSPKPSGSGEGDECVICLTNPKEVVILHCRHVCLCHSCATTSSTSWSYQCPVCRGRVSAMCARSELAALDAAAATT